MMVYYDGPNARITDSLFEAWCPRYQRFVLRDLHDLGLANDRPVGVPMRSLVPIGTVAAVAGATMVAPAAWVVAVPALGVAGVVGGVYYLRRPSELALLAHYRGNQVELYTSKDSRVFGQVKRALVRALEGAGR